ncbi:CBN-UGT-49 protein [Aphelenchoides avenae]|nr:CBN-UGT-49 protein [Aphelenchus avenae]
MHGGFNGLLESAIRGVPVVVIPLFLDQLRNAKLAEYRGIGYALEKTKLNKETLSEALKTVLEDEKYKKASVRLAKLIKNKPFTPEERFLQWTNFVAEHGELPELDVEGARMGTVEYFCLDVIGAFVLVVLATVYVLYKSVSKLLRALLGRSLQKGKME